MTSTKWTEPEVRALLERENLSYQDIALPHGLSTGGLDRSRTANAIFPDSLAGKTVLDVGCKYGYFCFEALRRGAKRVVGLDLDSDSLRKARLLAEVLGVDATFESFDVEVDELDEEFDYVLCLNLLHHLHNPLSALDKLIAHTRERLALEVATFGAHDLKKFSNLGPLSWLFRPLPLLPSAFRRTPVVLLGSGGKKPMSQQFFLSAPAVETLLREQRGSFARVRSLPSEHKGRFISVADKWQIDRLVVVSGPTSSGKSTLIRKLQAGELSQVARRAGMDDPAAWTVTGAQELRELDGPVVQKLLYHYDFLRPFLRGPNAHRRDQTLDILPIARSLTTVTVWTPPERLRQQIQAGEIERKTRDGRYRGKKRLLEIAEVYLDADRVRALYDNWFDYLAKIPGEHLVVELGDTPVIQTIQDWRGAGNP